MTKEKAAYLAIHDLFGRNGAAAWEMLRKDLGDDELVNLLIEHFAGAQAAQLQQIAVEATAVADKAVRGEWETKAVAE